MVLLDEPSSSLDRQAEFELRNTLTTIAKERTVIIVTHSPILLATCDDLVALDKGRIALAGPSKDILPKLFGTGAKSGQKKAAPPAQTANQQAPQPQQAPAGQKPASEKPQQPPAGQKPAPGQPNIAQPIKARPIPAKPIVAKPTPPKPIPTQPVKTEPAPAKPAAAKPAAAPPAPAKPAAAASPAKPDDETQEIDIPTPPEKTGEDKP